MIEKSSLKTPEKKYRPEVRWWLAEGFHTDETLKKEIQDLDETGFGAIEFWLWTSLAAILPFTAGERKNGSTIPTQ